MWYLVPQDHRLGTIDICFPSWTNVYPCRKFNVLTYSGKGKIFLLCLQKHDWTLWYQPAKTNPCFILKCVIYHTSFLVLIYTKTNCWSKRILVGRGRDVIKILSNPNQQRNSNLTVVGFDMIMTLHHHPKYLELCPSSGRTL